MMMRALTLPLELVSAYSTSSGVMRIAPIPIETMQVTISSNASAGTTARLEERNGREGLGLEAITV